MPNFYTITFLYLDDVSSYIKNNYTEFSSVTYSYGSRVITGSVYNFFSDIVKVFYGNCLYAELSLAYIKEDLLTDGFIVDSKGSKLIDTFEMLIKDSPAYNKETRTVNILL